VVHGFFADIIRRIGVPEVESRMLAAIERELAVTIGVPSAAGSAIEPGETLEPAR